MPDSLVNKEFRLALSEAVSFVRGRNSFVIISHYDADGLCAAAILAKALEREGKKFEIRIVKQLYRETIEELKSSGKTPIFSDFGSGQFLIIKENFNEFLVLDHHQSAVPNFEALHVNPFFFGVNGGSDVSGAGVCYLFAREMNSSNTDLSVLGIVGAVGDMQDFNGSLAGVNREIMQDAIQAGFLAVSKDLRLYGRISRPLTQYLEFSSSPILPGLTANENQCMRFLERTGIPLKDDECNSWRSYEDLSQSEKKVFSSSLILYLHEHNVPEWKIKSLIGEVYTLTREAPKSPLRDAKEFATLCNSCVVPGSEVYLNGSPTKIEDISTDSVFSVRENKIVKDKILEKHKLPLPAGVDVLRIVTQTGREIQLTQNHELLSVHGGESAWVAAENLYVGNHVAISVNLPEYGVKPCFDDFFAEKELMKTDNGFRLPNTVKSITKPFFDRDLGFLIGYIAGDGHVGDHEIDICFSRKPKDVRSFEIITETFAKQFGCGNPSISGKKTFFNASWGSKTLSTAIQRMGIMKGNKAKSVCFSKKLLEADVCFVAGLLSGLFSSDGNVYHGGIELSSHSEKLMLQTSFLLQRFGILSHTSSRNCPDCDSKKHRLLICGKSNISKFIDSIGFPDEERTNYLLKTIKSRFRSNEYCLPVSGEVYKLGKLLGIPNGWATNFRWYKRGKNPYRENVTKFIDFYNKRILECEKAIFSNDIKQILPAFKISVTAFSKKGGLSREWLSRVVKGKKPGKNALKKIRKSLDFYSSLLAEAKKIISQLKLFVDSDLHWDKIKLIEKIENPPEFVYDLTVENNHNYIVNGLVIHNCGRHSEGEVALAVCMGDRGEEYSKAMALLAEHRRQLRDGIEYVKANGIEEKHSFYFFDSGTVIKESLVGIIAGMLYGSGDLSEDKPIIAMARNEDGSLKISARATRHLVEKGLNLGGTFREICAELSDASDGGGHCLHPSTLVQDKKGVIKQILLVKAKDKLLARKQRILNAGFCNKVFKKNKKKIVELKTPLFEIKSSEDHLFFKYSDFGIIEESAGNLEVGDFVLGIKKIDFKGIPISLSNNSYIYLKESGLLLLRKKRMQHNLSVPQILARCSSFSKVHSIYDKEELASHRFQRNQLIELLSVLKIKRNYFLKKFAEKEFICAKKTLNKEISWLIGYTQGDGHIGKKRIEYKEPDNKIIAYLKNVFSENFSIIVKITDMKTYKKVRAYSADLCRFIKNNFPETVLLSGSLEVPQKVMQAKNNVLAFYLRGLFDADGGAYDRFVHLSMIDGTFLKTVQLLLLRFGILSRVNNGKKIFRLEITDFESLKLFRKSIGFTKNGRKQLLLGKIIKKQKTKKRNSNLYSPINYRQMRHFIIENNIPRNFFDFGTLYRRSSSKRITCHVLRKQFIRPLLSNYSYFSAKVKKKIRDLNHLFDSRIFLFCEIKKKKIIKNNISLIDLSMPNNKNFVANGFIVHNSIAAGCKVKAGDRERFLALLGEKLSAGRLS